METLGLRLDILIPGIVAIILLAVAGVCAWFSVWQYRKEIKVYWLDGAWSYLTIIFGALAGVITVIMLFVLVPYQPKYWQVYSVSGHVESVSNTFVQGGGDLSIGDFAVKLDSLANPVVVSNSRILTMKGDTVRMLCTEEWVPYGTVQINCDNPVQVTR